jgi:hypothetical protein
MTKKSFFIIFFLGTALIWPTQTQTGRFVVNLRSFTPPNTDPSTFRCLGTAISGSHILATASCVSVPPSLRILVHLQMSSAPGEPVFHQNGNI